MISTKFKLIDNSSVSQKYNLFSILIANYNNDKFLNDCYQSIINQTYQNWEAIIVDDCSDDNSLEVIQNLVEGDSRFKVFKNEKNRGCGYTKKRCVEEASGELLGFLDSDDALDSRAIEMMVENHNFNPQTSIISSRFDIYDINLSFLNAGKSGGKIPENKSYLTSGRSEICHFATFKRQFYMMTPGINPGFKRAVDQDLYFKLEEVGKHKYVDFPLYFYRHHYSNISLGENLIKAEYWHYKAKLDAYRRRKNMKSCDITNLTSTALRIQYANHLLHRINISNTDKKQTKLFLVINSILIAPWHRINSKLKIFWLILIGKK